MVYQYHAPRAKGGCNPHRIGTIPIGAIVYIQDGVRPFAFPQFAVLRDPWIVEAWCNREYCRQGGNSFIAGGHLAVVRSLRTGRRQVVADWILRACDDAGLMN